METTLQPTTDERPAVESWRLLTLIRAGYDLHNAERIATSHADLHTATDLLTAGCSVETACAILL